MQKTVLIQGAGGGGGNNLIASLRRSNLDLRILGSNCLAHSIAKSTADVTFSVPEATDPGYLPALQQLVRAEKIDLVIPNNDREVGLGETELAKSSARRRADAEHEGVAGPKRAGAGGECSERVAGGLPAMDA